MNTLFKKTIIIAVLLLGTQPLFAQSQTPPEGIWQGYDGEWKHVTSQLIALAEATPEDKFSWRPAKGVRSTSEVYMHIVLANFYLLSVTGPKMPEDLKENAEKAVTAKADVIKWLKRSIGSGKSRARVRKPGRFAAQSAYCGSGCNGGWNVSAHYCSCQRTYGTASGICAHDGRGAAVVTMKAIGKLTADECGYAFFSASSWTVNWLAR